MIFYAHSPTIMGLYSAVIYLTVSAGTLLYRPLFEHFGFGSCALASALCIAPVLTMSLLEVRRKAASVISVTAEQGN